MIEIESQGRWPTNAVADIMQARDELVKLGHGVLVAAHYLGCSIPIDVCALPRICEELNQFISNTTVSYRRFFEKNKIATIIEDDKMEDFTAVVSFDGNGVQINNVQLGSELGEKTNEL